MVNPPRTGIALAILTAAVWLAGCSSSSTAPPPPGVQPEIVNVTDSFEYQVQSIEGYTGTATYTWQNSGTTAAIDHSSVIGDGVGMVAVRDANGNEVYSGEMSASQSLVSQPGTAGSWTVTVTYTAFTGTVNFRVQKG